MKIMFDLVTDVCCLQHILPPDHIKAMQEIHRVLKPGGKFFSITARDDHSPSEDTPLRTMRGDEVKHLFIDSHFRITSLDHSAYTDRNGMYLASHWIVAAEKIT